MAKTNQTLIEALNEAAKTADKGATKPLAYDVKALRLKEQLVVGIAKTLKGHKPEIVIAAFEKAFPGYSITVKPPRRPKA